VSDKIFVYQLKFHLAEVYLLALAIVHEPVDISLYNGPRVTGYNKGPGTRFWSRQTPGIKALNIAYRWMLVSKKRVTYARQ
jgi:hypothetical protein